MRPADDDIHGRAQLVRDIGEELVLELRGLLRLCAGGSLASQGFPKPCLRARQSARARSPPISKLFWLERLPWGDGSAPCLRPSCWCVLRNEEVRRNLDDGNGARDRVLLDTAADVEPAHIGELHIEQDEIRHQLAGFLQRLLARVAFDHVLHQAPPQNALVFVHSAFRRRHRS